MLHLTSEQRQQLLLQRSAHLALMRRIYQQRQQLNMQVGRLAANPAQRPLHRKFGTKACQSACTLAHTRRQCPSCFYPMAALLAARLQAPPTAGPPAGPRPPSWPECCAWSRCACLLSMYRQLGLLLPFVGWPPLRRTAQDFTPCTAGLGCRAPRFPCFFLEPDAPFQAVCRSHAPSAGCPFAVLKIQQEL